MPSWMQTRIDDPPPKMESWGRSYLEMGLGCTFYLPTSFKTTEVSFSDGTLSWAHEVRQVTFGVASLPPKMARQIDLDLDSIVTKGDDVTTIELLRPIAPTIAPGIAASCVVTRDTVTLQGEYPVTGTPNNIRIGEDGATSFVHYLIRLFIKSRRHPALFTVLADKLEDAESLASVVLPTILILNRMQWGMLVKANAERRAFAEGST